MYRVLTDKEVKDVSLEILLFFDRYCRENGLRYYLAFGTLLGAVRHGGFIPWDDDIDVYVPRPDYDKMVDSLSDPAGRYVIVSSLKDRTYLNQYAKVLDTWTNSVSADGDTNPNGLGIDLFPLEGLPSDLCRAEREFHRMNRRWYNVEDRLASYYRMKPDSVVSKVKKALGSIAYKSGILSRGMCRLSASPFSADYDSACKVASIMGEYSGVLNILDKEWFEKTELSFEGYSFICPVGYHDILSKVYGDYMQLPPEEERRSTHTDKFIWSVTA